MTREEWAELVALLRLIQQELKDVNIELVTIRNRLEDVERAVLDVEKVIADSNEQY